MGQRRRRQDGGVQALSQEVTFHTSLRPGSQDQHRVAADAKDVVAPDCEQVRRSPNTGVNLNEELVAEGLPDIILEGLAPFPEG